MGAHRLKGPGAASLSPSVSVLDVDWNEAGRWRDSSIHRFKFRPDQTGRLSPGPHSRTQEDFLEARAQHVVMCAHLSEETDVATQNHTPLEQTCTVKEPIHERTARDFGFLRTSLLHILRCIFIKMNFISDCIKAFCSPQKQLMQYLSGLSNIYLTSNIS